MDPIVVSALVLVRDRRLLMVTARGRDVLYLPGGKQEAGETGEDALVRETREEVGLELDRSSLRELGAVRTQAHGEPEGREVHMRLWSARPTDDGAEPSPRARSAHCTGSRRRTWTGALPPASRPCASRSSST